MSSSPPRGRGSSRPRTPHARRIERDLHDGAQQRLVSLALNLQLLESRLEPDSAASGELAVVRDELAAALTELRELARGIHPSILTNHGLEPAIAALAARSTVPVELDLDSCGSLRCRCRRPRTSSSPKR